MRVLASTALFLLLLATLASAAPATDDRRVALVIGNGGYLHTTVLPNAPNDGRAMARTLRDLGFEVLEGIDPQVGSNLSVGADVRTLYSYADDASLEAENNLFQMQADVYFQLQLTPRWALYLDRGMSGTGEREVGWR